MLPAKEAEATKEDPGLEDYMSRSPKVLQRKRAGGERNLGGWPAAGS